MSPLQLPVALPFFDLSTLSYGWQFGLDVAPGELAQPGRYLALCLFESGACSLETFPAPDHVTPLADALAYPHWSGGTVHTPRGLLPVPAAWPVSRVEGMAPFHGTTTPPRPIERLSASGEAFSFAKLATTPAGRRFFAREALRGGLDFPPAEADLLHDFRSDLPPTGDTYHYGYPTSFSLDVGACLLGRAHVLDGVLLAVEPGRHAFLFDLWNVHLATMAAVLMDGPRALTHSSTPLADLERRLVECYHALLFGAHSTRCPDAAGGPSWHEARPVLEAAFRACGFHPESRPFTRQPLADDSLPDDPLVYARWLDGYRCTARVAPSRGRVVLPRDLLLYAAPAYGLAATTFGLSLSTLTPDDEANWPF